MPENDRRSGCLDEVNLVFVEREATPRLLMKLGIQLHSAVSWLSNTVSFLEVFGVDRVPSTVRNWVNKPDLQPESGRSPNRVAVDETVSRLDDNHYRLYAAVDTEPNDPLHTRLEPTTNTALADRFSAGLRDKHDIDDETVLVDGAASPQRVCRKHGPDIKHERHGDRNSIERVTRDTKHRTTGFSTFQYRRSGNC